jgi:hypothetical protein
MSAFFFAQKICKFCNFKRKYFNGNISGPVGIRLKSKYDIEVPSNTYRMVPL